MPLCEQVFAISYFKKMILLDKKVRCFHNLLKISVVIVLFWLSLVFLLAHLSRRLIGELIVYEGIRRPSVRRPSVCQHFQTTSPLKP